MEINDGQFFFTQIRTLNESRKYSHFAILHYRKTLKKETILEMFVMLGCLLLQITDTDNSLAIA